MQDMTTDPRERDGGGGREGEERRDRRVPNVRRTVETEVGLWDNLQSAKRR